MRHRSSAVPLTVAYAALIVYATLYPFSGWRQVTTSAPWDWLVLPWVPFISRFDVVANLIGYMPLGMLAVVAIVRSGGARRAAVIASVVAISLMSLTLEELQNLLPRRVPSRLDWLLNSAGGALGAVIGLGLVRLAVMARWQAWRDRWFVGPSASAITLLLLWPFALLFPPPLPLGLGQAVLRLPELVESALADTPWADAVAGWSTWIDGAETSLSPLAEATGVMLGLLAPCLLGFAVTRPGWRRLVLVAGAALLGFAATSLSTALNFAPEHGLAWTTPRALTGFALGAGLAAALAWLPRRAAAGVGLIVLTAGVAVVVHAPLDPYYAESLQAWEQGRFVRFHGLSQWIGLGWPYAAMLFLLLRLGARDDA